jgi:type IV pilus assembly protein PilA
MMNRTRKAFTLLELIVVVVVLGILALVAVPSFTGVINNSRGSVAENTAASIARDANALAAFNSGSAANETSNTNIDAAVAEAGLDTADGWSLNDVATGHEITLAKNGASDTFCIEVTAGTPDRATVASGTC